MINIDVLNRILEKDAREIIENRKSMDYKVLSIVEGVVNNRLIKCYSKPKAYDIFIIWKCKTLQNWQYLISTSLKDGMYYEVTFDGDKNRFYVDRYKKEETIVLEDK